MARLKNETANVREEKQEKAAVKKSFDPASLSFDEQAAVVEHFLGVHPRYFLYKGLNIQLNHGRFRVDGHHFNGWKPAARKYNSFDPDHDKT